MAVISLPTTTYPDTNASTRKGVAGEAISNGEIAYLAADGKWYKAEADSTITVAAAVGICVSTGVAGGSTVILTEGTVLGASGLKAGQTYILSNVAGDIADGVADITEDTSYVTFLAIGLSTTSLLFQPLASGVKLNLT
jgi:hypothetical protein